MSRADYERGYRDAQMDAFSEASLQVLREWTANGFVEVGPDTGAAYVMNWLNRAMSEPVPEENTDDE